MSQLSQEIPPSWAATKIRDIAHLINGDRGKNYPSRSSFVSSGVPFINAGHIIDGKLFLNDMNFISRADFEKLGSGKIDCGDILYCLRGSLGKAAIVDIKEGAIASSLVILRTTQTISNRYLHYFLVSPQGKELIEEFDNGSAQPNLSATSLAQFRIPLAPLPEQKRIADKLDSTLARVEACRDRLDRLPALLKRFRQSILAAATSGRLTEDWRATRSLDEAQRNPGTAAPASGADAFAPEHFGWTETTLANACVKITDGEHISPPLSESGIPLVSAKDVREWGVDFSDTKYVSEQFAETSRKRCDPEKNDVLVVSRGATVGRTCLVSTNQPFCLMGSVLLFKPNLALVLPRYFASVLSSPLGLEQLTKASGATAQAAIYIRDAKNLAVQLPPLEEQREIVRRVEILFAFADRLEARLTTARKQAEQLTPVLLAKAFRGELVPQDPNDEPATELLKRLATTRSEAPKVKRGRKAAA